MMWPFVERPKYKHPATLCAWCRLVLTWITTDNINAPLVSHGICDTCSAKVLAELDAKERAA
jgi:hypothetical protein